MVHTFKERYNGLPINWPIFVLNLISNVLEIERHAENSLPLDVEHLKHELASHQQCNQKLQQENQDLKKKFDKDLSEKDIEFSPKKSQSNLACTNQEVKG